MTLPSEALPEALVALLGSAKARQGLPSALFETQAVHLDVMEPTGIVFTGDWHLGAQGMAYDRFERDLGQLAYAKRLLKDQLHIIVMGDLIDGYLPVGTPRNPTQLLSPREQRKAAVEALKLLQPTLVLEGDHDSWHSKQDIEHDWLYDACALSGWNYSQWGSELRLHTNEHRPIRILARHRYNGARTNDHLKPHKNLHLEHGPADVVALAHFHSNPGVFTTFAKRPSEGRFYAVQSGTYKYLDDYGKKLGFEPGAYGVPGLVIYPDGAISVHDEYDTMFTELV